MRTILKHFIINTITLYLISQAVNGIKFAEGSYTLLLAGLVLTLTTLIIRPIINILLLPINLITFGLFKWVGYAITLYLVTLIVPGFKLLDFVFKGYNSYWFSLPAFSLPGFLAFIAFSFLISFISSIIYWVFK
ncbi:MAG TPA: phage holin family protein [Alphaproteobacteria bacterium]|jgi:putative membrane protein|nr:phage holin family protein [Alphaproteobacteria bacterium]